jgi:hypothetical protein
MSSVEVIDEATHADLFELLNKPPRENGKALRIVKEFAATEAKAIRLNNEYNGAILKNLVQGFKTAIEKAGKRGNIHIRYVPAFEGTSDVPARPEQLILYKR